MEIQRNETAFISFPVCYAYDNLVCQYLFHVGLKITELIFVKVSHFNAEFLNRLLL